MSKLDESPAAVVVFDLDGTLTNKDSYLPFLSAHLLRYPSRLIYLPWLAIAVVIYYAGLRDNTWLKTTFLRAIVGGCSVEEASRTATIFWNSWQQTRLRPELIEQLRQHQRDGDRVVLASASLDLYVTEFAQRLHIDEVLCSEAEVAADGTVTGNLVGLNCYGEEKLRRIRELIGPPADIAVAYSDHIADAPLMRGAVKAIAVFPEAQLEALAQSQGWVVIR